MVCTKKLDMAHGRFDAVEVSRETQTDFFDSKMKSQAKKVKADPEKVSLFCHANDNHFENW